MHDFIEALTSEKRNNALPEEYDYFGSLVGSWAIEYVDRDTLRAIKGEWHFSRILDGTAIQDVIVLPDYECGTTLRFFQPDRRVWEIVYCYTEKIMRFTAVKQGSEIVLTNVADAGRQWVFAEIEEQRFHWQDVTVNKDGARQVKYDVFAERMR